MRTILAFVILTSSSTAAEMKVQRDLPYADAKTPAQKLDVYAPAEGKNNPILVWIHGGGWRRGDKTAVQRKPQAFVDRGCVFVSVNYRLIPDVSVKEMAGDIARAVKWVRDHAAEYGGDSQRIIIAGHSAGAHLAALVATDESYLKAEGLALSDIKGCIPVDTAVYDIPQQLKRRGPLRSQIYKAAFGEDETALKELSPVSHVAKSKGIPPFLILHVDSRPDSTEQSQEFAKRLQKAGVEAKVVSAEGKTHGTINRDLGLPDDPPTKAVYAFLKAVTEDSKDAAIKKDRKRIEGTWRIVALEMDGNQAQEEDAKKLTVVNGADGTWSLRSEGKEISKGTSTFDPAQKPKAIDFTPTEGGGKDNHYVGIYELGDDSRKLCFAAKGKDRPTKFSAEAGSGQILVKFERVKSP